MIISIRLSALEEMRKGMIDAKVMVEL